MLLSHTKLLCVHHKEYGLFVKVLKMSSYVKVKCHCFLHRVVPFSTPESKSNLTDMTSTIPSSPTPSPAPDQTSVMRAVEDCGCELPTALLAIVVVLIVAIFGLIVLVVALIVALARTNRKLKPSPKER